MLWVSALCSNKIVVMATSSSTTGDESTFMMLRSNAKVAEEEVIDPTFTTTKLDGVTNQIWSTMMNFTYYMDPAKITPSKTTSKRRKTSMAVESQSSAHRFLEFGDFAEDLPFDCPATTTCPVVCVANLIDCPTVCEAGLTLCLSGHCALDCTEFDTFDTPCACETLPVACPKVVDLYDTCFERFQTPYYDDVATCLDVEEAAIPLLSWSGPWFLASYFGIIIVSLLVILWCLYNEKLFPISTSTMPIRSSIVTPNSDNVINTSTSNWTQTGYKTHPIGLFIHLLVTITAIAIQLLMFYLTIMYYVNQDSITRFPKHFQSEVQVLKAFEVVWMIGLAWSLILRYPDTGLYNLFLRRCNIEEATHVAVVSPKKSIEDTTIAPNFYGQVLSMMWVPFDTALRVIFSYPYGIEGYDTTFCRVTLDPRTKTRSILHRMRRYVYDEKVKGYVAYNIHVGTTFGDLLDQSDGITSSEALNRLGNAGPNVIALEEPTLIGCIAKEFSKPFYVYQNFVLWGYANFFYWYMAIVHTLVRLTGALVVAYFQYQSEATLYKLAHVVGEVEVLRDGAFERISVKDVVPGDVVAIKMGEIFCDMVVLQGTRLLVDESALTGESTPVIKTALDTAGRKLSYDRLKHKGNTVMAGTEVIEVDDDDKCLGLVMTTGSYTGKGELLSEVLSYERHKFKFDDDVKLVLFILLMQMIVFVSLVFLFLNDDWVFSWFYGLYVMATVLPPLLPTCFVVSVGISANRLQEKNIACSNPQGILIAGKINAAFFDKTGTLTKQGLDFLAVNATKSNEEWILIGMAVCHTLGKRSDGSLMGNHVDEASFEFSGATLQITESGRTQIDLEGRMYTVLKHFVFDCHRTTQSVIIEDDKGAKFIFVKGSAEAIEKICDPATIPSTYVQTVREASKAGIYQLAVASRPYDLDVDVAEASRDDVEKSLSFIGFVSFQNFLRDESYGVIKELEEGGITSTMITGDSVLTGICIAREAGMIKQHKQVILGQKSSETEIEWVNFDTDAVEQMPSIEFLLTHSNVDLALTGEAWSFLLENDPKYASMIASYVRVFGRCKPTDKVSVVANFVSNGYKTLMCGDGQNDTGSLKTAHVGISLSSSDASLVAPFTSTKGEITSVTEILREGRCAIASALAAYSFYILYGQIETFQQVLNAYLSITFYEWCWVFLDAVWSITLAFSLPLARAASRLTPRQPTDSLLGAETLCSVCGTLAWNYLFMVIAILAMWNQDWFQCRKWNSDDVSNVLIIGDNYESSLVFIIGGFQIIASSMVLNYGYTFRKGWWHNYIFVFFSITWLLFIFVMTIYPSSFSCIFRVNCINENTTRGVTSDVPVYLNNPFNTTIFPVHFRWILVTIMALNFLTISIWQYFFVNGYLLTRLESSAKPITATDTAAPPLTKSIATEVEESNNNLA